MFATFHFSVSTVMNFQNMNYNKYSSPSKSNKNDSLITFINHRQSYICILQNINAGFLFSWSWSKQILPRIKIDLVQFFLYDPFKPWTLWKSNYFKIFSGLARTVKITFFFFSCKGQELHIFSCHQRSTYLVLSLYFLLILYFPEFRSYWLHVMTGYIIGSMWFLPLFLGSLSSYYMYLYW